jgi:hypothetical protein
MLRSTVTRTVRCSFHQLSSACSSQRDNIFKHGSPAAAVPLLEQYRPRWPQLPMDTPAEKDEFNGILPIPETRTIPASVLRFQMSATFAHGSSLIYEHMSFNPADFKVGLKVSTTYLYSVSTFNNVQFRQCIPWALTFLFHLLQVYLADLNLSKDEEYIMIRMVAKRFNVGRREIRLTTERFPNRIENKRYLIYLLENLVAEAKNLAVIQHQSPVAVALDDSSDAVPEVAPI